MLAAVTILTTCDWFQHLDDEYHDPTVLERMEGCWVRLSYLCGNQFIEINDSLFTHYKDEIAIDTPTYSVCHTIIRRNLVVELTNDTIMDRDFLKRAELIDDSVTIDSSAKTVVVFRSGNLYLETGDSVVLRFRRIDREAVLTDTCVGIGMFPCAECSPYTNPCPGIPGGLTSELQ
ncbi:MAG: hypothetical protein JW863_12675 [Chitinispirillaceae bacterium]|nr:hypothetical protein [Chitinispirillaceae bacterium]